MDQSPLPANAAIGSSQEESFCRAWVEPMDRHRVRQFYLISCAFHIFLLCVEPFVKAHTHLITPAYVIHALSLPLLVYGLIKLKSFELSRKLLQLVNGILLLGLNIILIYGSRHWINHPDMLIAFSLHIILGIFYPFMDRQPLKITLSWISVHIALVWVALWVLPIGFVAASLASFAYIFAALTAVTVQRSEWQVAKAEFRFRASIVPEHIVRNSAQSPEEFTEFFRPTRKFCVCLSSYWHQIHSLEKKLAATQLTASLNEFHDACQILARRFFPFGNYYSDWFGDELMFIAYADNQSTERDVVNQMAGLAIELLNQRPQFARVHGLPEALDIGLAAGEALVGLMGPDGHIKATAIGEPPSLARALQHAGRTLRQELDNRDRILFSREVLMRLSLPVDVKPYTPRSPESQKSILQREIYHIETEATLVHDTSHTA